MIELPQTIDHNQLKCRLTEVSIDNGVLIYIHISFMCYDPDNLLNGTLNNSE